MCDSADFTGSNGAPDRLVVSFNAEDKQISFTIYGTKSDNDSNTKPGLNPDQRWIENGNERINYKYVSFMSSPEDLNYQRQNEATIDGTSIVFRHLSAFRSD